MSARTKARNPERKRERRIADREKTPCQGDDHILNPKSPKEDWSKDRKKVSRLEEREKKGRSPKKR